MRRRAAPRLHPPLPASVRAGGASPPTLPRAASRLRPSLHPRRPACAFARPPVRPPAGPGPPPARLSPLAAAPLASTLPPGPARPRATAAPPAATPPPPRLFRPPAAAPDEVMATANFGKIQIGIYVEIKRSDGEPRRADRPFDCFAGLWGREGGGPGAFVCGVVRMRRAWGPPGRRCSAGPRPQGWPGGGRSRLDGPPRGLR